MAAVLELYGDPNQVPRVREIETRIQGLEAMPKRNTTVTRDVQAKWAAHKTQALLNDFYELGPVALLLKQQATNLQLEQQQLAAQESQVQHMATIDQGAAQAQFGLSQKAQDLQAQLDKILRTQAILKIASGQTIGKNLKDLLTTAEHRALVEAGIPRGEGESVPAIDEVNGVPIITDAAFQEADATLRSVANYTNLKSLVRWDESQARRYFQQALPVDATQTPYDPDANQSHAGDARSESDAAEGAATSEPTVQEGPAAEAMGEETEGDTEVQGDSVTTYRPGLLTEMAGEDSIAQERAAQMERLIDRYGGHYDGIQVGLCQR